jgi:predicted Ser/Thr protein kinase
VVKQGGKEVILRLVDEFEYLHQPVGSGDVGENALLVGRDRILSAFTHRLHRSRGGAFLITGYRGVGKTSFTLQLIDRLRRRIETKGTGRLVDVYLTFARPMKPLEVLYHVLRSLYARLVELRILTQLEPDLQADLGLALRRTACSISQESSEEAASSFEMSGIKGRLFDFLPKVSASAKRTANKALAYLAYDEKTAEFDLLNIARQLIQGYRPRRALLAPGTWFGAPRVPLSIVIIFDELDKVDEDDTGRAAFDRILGTLKNLFTVAGITFVFVAGRRFHERWLEETGRGDSLYESIFAESVYLPGLWTEMSSVYDRWVRLGEERTGGETYEDFKKYLSFTGRGIPRRIIRSFNERVRLVDDAPALVFTPAECRRLRFHADLHDFLQRIDEELLDLSDEAPDPHLTDQRRLCAYHLVDWVLANGAAEFSHGEMLERCQQLARVFTVGDAAAVSLVSRLIDRLRDGDYLEDVARTTIVRPEGPVRRYQLTKRRRHEMGHRRALPDAVAPVEPAQPASTTQFAGGRYVVTAPLAHGGMSSLHLALDVRTKANVVLKVAREEATQRGLVREARALKLIRHPGVVRLLEDCSATPEAFIVLEVVPGMTLGQLLRSSPTLAPEAQLALARDIAEALAAVHRAGVVWRDPKPNNIMVRPDGDVVILDFGLARLPGDDDSTLDGSVCGTPAYMSPEQARGVPVTPASDVYAIGAVLFELVTGRRAFSGEIVQLLEAHARGDMPDFGDAAGSPFEPIIRRCLALDPAARFADGAALLEALPETAASPAARAHTAQALDVGLNRLRQDDMDTIYPESLAQAPRLQPVHEVRIELRGIERRLSIGRASANDVVLEDDKVSRFHAIVYREDDGFRIEDLNTANGTWLDGKPVRSERLSAGQVVVIGSHRVSVVEGAVQAVA